VQHDSLKTVAIIGRKVSVTTAPDNDMEHSFLPTAFLLTPTTQESAWLVQHSPVRFGLIQPSFVRFLSAETQAIRHKQAVLNNALIVPGFV